MTAAPTHADALFLAFQSTLAGRYSIDRELGRGGMGIVYLAREVHLDRLVAIKLLPPERLSQDGLRERFLREARLSARLSHPNIIPIHAVEDTGDFVYFVMAFVDGETLAQRVRVRGPLSATEGARVLREVAWALAYAHDHGVIHRDVKPENILLEAATGRALVADFGIAAAVGDLVGETVIGTPEFMSPEQALCQPLDARSDIYSLGASAFYAFSGRLPFDGKTITEVLAKQVTAAAPSLGSLGLTVPRRLAGLVDRCLSKEREHRPATAQQLADQIGVALEQRREVPAALRAFVKRSGRLDGGGTLIAALLLLPVSGAAASLLGSAAAAWTVLGAGVTIIPFTYLAGAARKLVRQGFTHADLAPAFRAEMDTTREEFASERHVKPPSVIDRWLPRVAAVPVALWALGILGMIVAWDARSFQFAGNVMAASAMGIVLFGLPALVVLQRRGDLDTSFWARVWKGPIGRLAFAVARRFRGKALPQAALTHRATELSLGLAAEQLYDALPKVTRRELRALPPTLARLQRDAQELRARHDHLQEALADAGDAATLPEYAEVRDMRDRVHGKLGEAVGALETIRLNLLRLHAGSATVAGLTTHLGVAAEVSEAVERLIAAQDDVERFLRVPRDPTPTPA